MDKSEKRGFPPKSFLRFTAIELEPGREAFSLASRNRRHYSDHAWHDLVASFVALLLLLPETRHVLREDLPARHC